MSVAWTAGAALLAGAAVVTLTAWIAVALHARRARADQAAFSAGARLRSPYPSSRVAWWLRSLALALLLLALAGPRLAGDAVAEPPDRLLVFVLDVSMSMRARDVSPTRLDEARRQLREAARRVTARRVALVAFAAEPSLVCPPTTDLAAFDQLLEATTEAAALAGPSRAATAVERALALLGEEAGDLVLVSDGEFPADDRERLLSALRARRRDGTRIATVGVGTDAGAPVPVRGATRVDETALGGPSRLDAALLDTVAASAGGRHVDLVAGGQIDVWDALGPSGPDASVRHLMPFGPSALFGYPLALSLVLLAADAYMAGARRAVAEGVR